MKLKVEGMEEIEITDPKGLCKSPVQQGIPIGQPPMPSQGGGAPLTRPWPGANPFTPTPQVPTPIHPGIHPVIPGISGPAIYTKKNDDPRKWEIGGDAIQRAGEELDKQKWEQNWQSSLGVASENIRAGELMAMDGDGHIKKARGEDGNGNAS